MIFVMSMARRMYSILTGLRRYLLVLWSSFVSGNGQLFSGGGAAADDGSGVIGPAKTVVHTPWGWSRSSFLLSFWMTTEIVFLIVPGGGGLLGDGWT